MSTKNWSDPNTRQKIKQGFEVTKLRQNWVDKAQYYPNYCSNKPVQGYGTQATDATAHNCKTQNILSNQLQLG